LTAHENMDKPVKFWGTVKDMGKILLGFCSHLGKVTEAFQKIPNSFGAVVKKPGLGVNYPLPLAIGWLTQTEKFRVVSLM